MQTFIYIATTQGPVRVQAITEEDPDIKSVVCLDGMAEPLAISDRYHDFVKKGTGLIHREFGHGSYRVDVDKPIDQGDSWQLGLYCAHVLHQKKQLCNVLPQEGDCIFFVTGAVKSNGEIAFVDRIKDKFQVASSQLQQWVDQDCDVIYLLAANQMDVPNVDELLADGIDTEKVNVRLVQNISDVRQCLSKGQGTVEGRHRVTAAKRSLMFTSIVLLLFLVVAVVGWKKNENVLNKNDVDELVDLGNRIFDQSVSTEYTLKTQALSQRGDVSEEQRFASQRLLILSSRVSGHPGKCEDVPEQRLELVDDRWFQSVSLKNLCALHWRSDSAKTLLALSLDRLGMIQIIKTGSGWKIPLPLEQGNDRVYAVIAVYDSSGWKLANKLDRQLLRWEFEEVAVSLDDVTLWLENQPFDTSIYGHVLRR
ncbi:hypothetical protein A9Q81_19070 [Gammaproteobacteria bacterium 42_54_T18]|nr:hypothetical protein A9Q81_19070 [Gammaproteobacteria bacterium 42_54_T18]